MVYGHANGSDIEHTVDEVLRYKRDGLQGDPRAERRAGPQKVYGVGRGTLFYEPADADLPTEHDWSTEKYLDHAPQAVRALREQARLRAPPAARRASPADADRGRAARQVARAVSTCSGWKTPTPAENQEAFRLIRQHTTTPLAVGEIFNTIWDCKDLIENQLIDYIRATVVHAGGITHLRRIADFAVAVPGAHRLPRRHRPVAGVHGRGAALRPVGAELRHPGVHAPHRGDRRGVPACLHASPTACCTRAMCPAMASRSTRRWRRKYPYQRAYLPVNRLQHDGTLWNW